MSPLRSADTSSALWLAMPSITLWDPPQSPSDSRAQPQIDGLKNSKTLCAYVWMPVVYICAHTCAYVYMWCWGHDPGPYVSSWSWAPNLLHFSWLLIILLHPLPCQSRGEVILPLIFHQMLPSLLDRCQADMHLCSDLCSLASTSSSTGPSRVFSDPTWCVRNRVPGSYSMAKCSGLGTRE